jgi:hypothetical protein
VRLGLAIAIGVLVAGGVAWALHAPGRRTLLPGGAFLTGGSPAGEPAIEHVLADELPILIRDTDEDVHGRSDSGIKRAVHAALLRISPAMSAYGPALANAWADLVDALGRWDAAPSKRHLTELRASAHEVSAQLEGLGIGYQLEANAIGDHAVVFAFLVEDVAYEHSGDRAVRVLSLRRIDLLNVKDALLGMQTDDGADPVVLLDAVDELARTKLYERGYFQLGDESWASSPDGQRLGEAAGAAIAHELAGKSGLDARELLAASVRRHEARHAIDIARTNPPPDPPALARYVPGDSTLVLRSRAELTAYLCQIGSDPATPHLALWNLANIGFGSSYRGTAESFVAAVVIEGLARHLGVRGTDVPVVKGTTIDRTRLAALALPLAALSDDDLRHAARELWVDLYHTPFEPMVEASATIEP